MHTLGQLVIFYLFHVVCNAPPPMLQREDSCSQFPTSASNFHGNRQQMDKTDHWGNNHSTIPSWITRIPHERLPLCTSENMPTVAAKYLEARSGARTHSTFLLLEGSFLSLISLASLAPHPACKILDVWLPSKMLAV